MWDAGRLFIEQSLITNHRLPLFSLRASHSMSAVPSTSTSHSKFVSIFNAALETYNRKTKQDLSKHPLLPRLQFCNSPEAILTVLREQAPEFNKSQNSDNVPTKWITPTVNVLYSFSATLGGVVGLVNIRLFFYDTVRPNIYFSGIPTSEHNFYGDWRSSPGPCLSRFLCTTYFNTLTLRQLKMSALSETSLSTSSTALSISSTVLRFTLAFHRPRL